MSRRRALVTGGGQGIGLAIVERLAQAGIDCVALDHSSSGVSAVEQLGVTHGVSTTLLSIDVSDPTAVAEVIAAASASTPFDIVVTSAGVALHGSSLDVTPDQWAHVFRVNVNGTFWCVREAVRHMIAAGKPGAVVMIGSISGAIANAPQAQTAYNASKGAVHMLAKCLAVEWVGEGIRVNAVAPGYVGTELTRQGVNPEWVAEWERRTPQQRMGRPEEIAELVEFLASDRASYLTGTVVNADGGYTAW